MSIWQKEISVELLDAQHLNTAVSRLGMQFLEVGDDFIRARAPVDQRTTWGDGLHSGVNVVLAETLGSCGGHYASSLNKRAVGLSISADHIKTATSGWVTGVTQPMHIGDDNQVWQIRITDDTGDLVCVSKITLALLSTA
jgi:uncharacterized protein (TIGR00369 family)